MGLERTAIEKYITSLLSSPDPKRRSQGRMIAAVLIALVVVLVGWAVYKVVHAFSL